MSECVVSGCDNEAEVRVKPTPMGGRREFCPTCYEAWKRGAHTVFTHGVPRGERIT